jgi:hypothetical protein
MKSLMGKRVIDATYQVVRKDGSKGPKQGPHSYPHPDWPSWPWWRQLLFLAIWLPMVLGMKFALLWITGAIGLRPH